MINNYYSKFMRIQSNRVRRKTNNSLWEFVISRNMVGMGKILCLFAHYPGVHQESYQACTEVEPTGKDKLRSS